MAKTIIHALIACALGVALGLLWDSEARAANRDEDVPGGWRDKARLCEKLTRPDKIMIRGEAENDMDFVCWLRHAPEVIAIEMASEMMNECKPGSAWRRDKLEAAPPEVAAFMVQRFCTEPLPYIKQRWGY